MPSFAVLLAESGQVVVADEDPGAAAGESGQSCFEKGAADYQISVLASASSFDSDECL